MVRNWLKEVAVHQSVYADNQIIHLYRWLSSPEAFLYEPALKRTLHSLMEKYFTQLIAELEHLNAQIVYANLNKIIICTRKHRVADAHQ